MLLKSDKIMLLDDEYCLWLGRFEPCLVIFYSLGSLITLEKDQYQELCLAVELTGVAFVISVKLQRGSSAIQEALPVVGQRIYVSEIDCGASVSKILRWTKTRVRESVEEESYQIEGDSG